MITTASDALAEVCGLRVLLSRLLFNLVWRMQKFPVRLGYYSAPYITFRDIAANVCVWLSASDVIFDVMYDVLSSREASWLYCQRCNTT